MTFVIASTSTTDFNGRDPVEQYDIFLMPAHKRASAWWNGSVHEAMRFETREAAQAEWDRLFGHKEREYSAVKELVAAWVPQHFGANPATFVIEWYATRKGEQAILCGTREEARAMCRRLNDELRATGVSIG